jgi:hypothetical protein
MGPRWLLYVAVCSQLLPPLAAVLVGVRNRARIGIVIWCLLQFGTDVVAGWLGHGGNNNIWLEYISIPSTSAVILWTLAAWQTKPTPRLAIRVVTPLYVIAYFTLVIAVEDTSTFSLVAGTLSGLVLISLTVYTLLVRSLDEGGNLTQFDWFWVCSGLALYFSCATAIEPLSRYLESNASLPQLWALLEVRAVADTVAMMVIARGLLCPMPPHPFGGYSSPRSSGSSSSS